MSDLQELALSTPCAYCDAPAESWCQTSSGDLAQQLHSARTAPILSAYGQGYSDAQGDCGAEA